MKQHDEERIGIDIIRGSIVSHYHFVEAFSRIVLFAR